MVRTCFLMLLLHALLISCSDTSNETTHTTADTATIAGNINPTDNFYKRLEGTIAEQPVVMHLQKTANRYDGIYYYKNNGRWLQLFVDSVSADTLYIEEWANGDNWTQREMKNAHLRLAIRSGAEGVWISGDGKKIYTLTLKENYPEGAYPFYIQTYSDSIFAFDQMKGSPKATIEYAFVASEENEWLNTQIKKIMRLDPASDFKTGLQKAATEYLQEYKKELTGYNDTSGMPMETLNYMQMQQAYVRYNANGFVVLEHSYYEYTGGAHGNYGSTFYCLDVKEQKKIQLSDLLTADSVTLQPLIEKYFREQYHIGKKALNTVLFENYLGPNKNFYFNEKGMGFLYNPYEAASYAQGQINVFIPFTAIKQYLTSSIKQRLSIP